MTGAASDPPAREGTPLAGRFISAWHPGMMWVACFEEKPAIPIVIENEDLSAALRQVNGSVEFVSKDGRSLGVFARTGAMPPDLEPRISDEEFRRRLNDPNAKWYTAASVAAKMREWWGVK